MGSWTLCVLVLAERQNNKRLFCGWDCVSISRWIGTQISGQLEDGAMAQMTVAIRRLL
jgi:hypothetical protein